MRTVVQLLDTVYKKGVKVCGDEKVQLERRLQCSFSLQWRDITIHPKIGKFVIPAPPYSRSPPTTSRRFHAKKYAKKYRWSKVSRPALSGVTGSFGDNVVKFMIQSFFKKKVIHFSI